MLLRALLTLCCLLGIWASPAAAQDGGVAPVVSPAASAPPPPPAASEPPARPTTTVSFRFGYYEQEDEDGLAGNPFLDEDATVLEPVLLVEQEISPDTTATAKFSHDYVSSASIARLDNYPSQSGASADYYFGIDLGARTRVAPDFTLSANGRYAIERDYRSAGFTVGLRWESPDRNTAMGASVTGYYDTVIKIRFNGANDGSSPRRTLSFDLDAYRALTPWLHAEGGYTLSRQWGFMATSINAVVIEGRTTRPNFLLTNAFPGVEIEEDLPGLRIRHALWGRVRGLLGPVALELLLRGYVDSWDVEAFEVQPRAFVWIVEDLLRLRLGYRFYRQTRARYHRDHFREERYHRTQDPDLAAFDSHTAGGQLALFLGERLRLDVAIDRVWRSDDLDQLRTSAGLRVRF